MVSVALATVPSFLAISLILSHELLMVSLFFMSPASFTQSFFTQGIVHHNQRLAVILSVLALPSLRPTLSLHWIQHLALFPRPNRLGESLSLSFRVVVSLVPSQCRPDTGSHVMGVPRNQSGGESPTPSLYVLIKFLHYYEQV